MSLILVSTTLVKRKIINQLTCQFIQNLSDPKALKLMLHWAKTKQNHKGKSRRFSFVIIIAVHSWKPCVSYKNLQ